VALKRTSGDQGEDYVAGHLERQGFQIVARNARVGRLEIDLVARRGDLLVFCEVRSRQNSSFLNPIETIDRAKVGRIRRAATQWLAANPQNARQLRFDAAAVVFDCDPPRLDYYESAF
jgi:putative endonuclease